MYASISTTGTVLCDAELLLGRGPRRVRCPLHAVSFDGGFVERDLVHNGAGTKR